MHAEAISETFNPAQTGGMVVDADEVSVRLVNRPAFSRVSTSCDPSSFELQPSANTIRFSREPFQFGKNASNSFTTLSRTSACSRVTRKFVPRAHRKMLR